MRAGELNMNEKRIAKLILGLMMAPLAVHLPFIIYFGFIELDNEIMRILSALLGLYGLVLWFVLRINRKTILELTGQQQRRDAVIGSERSMVLWASFMLINPMFHVAETMWPEYEELLNSLFVGSYFAILVAIGVVTIGIARAHDKAREMSL
jgi:xanthine/uracil permease